MVEPDEFEVGANLAVSPGCVVVHTEVFELIQYRPATTGGPARSPLLIVPPTINKFYVDRPGARPQPGRVPGRPAACRCS